MHHTTDRIAHTTAFVTPVVEHWLEREIAQGVHPMKDRSDNPSHHERPTINVTLVNNLINAFNTVLTMATLVSTNCSSPTGIDVSTDAY